MGDQVNEDYDELKKNHNELKEKFSILSVDYEKIMEERRIEHEKRERERREIEEKTTAAEVIQAYFRSYKVRKLLKGKGKNNGPFSPSYNGFYNDGSHFYGSY